MIVVKEHEQERLGGNLSEKWLIEKEVEHVR